MGKYDTLKVIISYFHADINVNFVEFSTDERRAIVAIVEDLCEACLKDRYPSEDDELGLLSKFLGDDVIHIVNNDPATDDAIESFLKKQELFNVDASVRYSNKDLAKPLYDYFAARNKKHEYCGEQFKRIMNLERLYRAGADTDTINKAAKEVFWQCAKYSNDVITFVI